MNCMAGNHHWNHQCLYTAPRRKDKGWGHLFLRTNKQCNKTSLLLFLCNWHRHPKLPAAHANAANLWCPLPSKLLQRPTLLSNDQDSFQFNKGENCNRDLKMILINRENNYRPGSVWQCWKVRRGCWGNQAFDSVYKTPWWALGWHPWASGW